jgi:NAD(P)-dependent dehydrogenase (short-subunit alcohol dehydrogenase family)
MPRTAIITGASRGLGEALARRLAADGFATGLCARHEAPLAAVAGALRRSGAEVLAQACDVREGAAVERFVGEVHRRWGRIDLLINNAGVLGPRAPLADISEGDWLAVMDANLNGAYRLCRAVVPIMITQREGCIVNITSSVGRRARALWGAYSVSKFGIEGLTQLLHEEYGPAGIRCVAFNPGGTATAMRAEAYPNEDPAALPPPAQIAEALARLVAEPNRFPSGGSYDARPMLARD